MATTSLSTGYKFNKFAVVMATVKMRLINITRYKSNLMMGALTPILIALLPILLGRATGGEQAGEIFASNTGTTNYISYMLIGSITFEVVSTSLWLVAFWVRNEMERGTLEAIYITPTPRILILAGVSIYGLIRTAITGSISYFLGSWIFGVDPLDGEILIALAFIMAGIIPLYGLTMAFGALILKLKEAGAILNVMQWIVSFFMGVFFPIATLPTAVQWVAKLFPPTWMTNGVRSAMLGIDYFFSEWYFDLAVLGVFILIAPLAGAIFFKRTEDNVRMNEGLGRF